jgi:hypothetical protein
VQVLEWVLEQVLEWVLERVPEMVLEMVLEMVQGNVLVPLYWWFSRHHPSLTFQHS